MSSRIEELSTARHAWVSCLQTTAKGSSEGSSPLETGVRIGSSPGCWSPQRALPCVPARSLGLGVLGAIWLSASQGAFLYLFINPHWQSGTQLLPSILHGIPKSKSSVGQLLQQKKFALSLSRSKILKKQLLLFGLSTVFLFQPQPTPNLRDSW